MNAPIVQLRGVSKEFGAHRAVDALDLDVPRGGCFGLLGPNGAGKTTTLRMIYGVTRASAGEVRVFGLDVAAEPRAVRARLGVTLQENALVESLSAAENLRIFGRYHLLDPAHAKRRAQELLAFLELDGHAAQPVSTLSGGFQRRVAIALSLMNEPELLILDEPTTGLDPAVRLSLWAKVRELRAAGTTVLLTTHYMDEAERLCDRVAIMSAGRVVCAGAPATLIAERLAPEAVEIECAPDEAAALLDGCGSGLPRLRAGNRVTLFAEDAGALAAQLRARADGQDRHVFTRPANLEDVFLATTGTSLGAGA